MSLELVWFGAGGVALCVIIVWGVSDWCIRYIFGETKKSLPPIISPPPPEVTHVRRHPSKWAFVYQYDGATYEVSGEPVQWHNRKAEATAEEIILELHLAGDATKISPEPEVHYCGMCGQDLKMPGHLKERCVKCAPLTFYHNQNYDRMTGRSKHRECVRAERQSDS